MVVSRATFGVVGNVVPAVLVVIVRLFWGAVLLWMMAASTARILTNSRLGGPFTELQLTLLAMTVGFAVALVVGLLGYSLFARIQMILTIVTGVLLVGVIALTWPSVSISRALTVTDGPWILAVTGVVLVFSFVGLAWASSSADVARYQRPSSSGASSMLSASFGATIPAFLLIAYGSLLAASDPATAQGFAASPIDILGHMLPGWYPVPLIAAVALSLLSGVTLSAYSGGFAIQAAGVRVSRPLATVLVGAVLLALALLMAFTVRDVVPIFRDLATTIAVPIAAWAGIFGAEMMIRRRPFDSDSLFKRGGVYPTVNWINLAMLLVASAIGFGLSTASVVWLRWEGYLFSAFGVSLRNDFVGTDIGVLVALVIGLLTPLILGIPEVRRQERLRA
jgi:purine-cytosine permease-like protein